MTLSLVYIPLHEKVCPPFLPAQVNTNSRGLIHVTTTLYNPCQNMYHITLAVDSGQRENSRKGVIKPGSCRGYDSDIWTDRDLGQDLFIVGVGSLQYFPIVNTVFVVYAPSLSTVGIPVIFVFPFQKSSFCCKASTFPFLTAFSFGFVFSFWNFLSLGDINITTWAQKGGWVDAPPPSPQIRPCMTHIVNTVPI